MNHSKYLFITLMSFLVTSCDGSSSSNNNENSSATIFNENFEDELTISNGTELGFTDFSSFTVEGSVDLISSGDFGVTCAVGNACIDLDGTSADVINPASVLTSQNISIEPGEYKISLYLGGNQRSPTPICVAADSVGISMEPFLAEIIFTFDSSEELSLRDIEFTASTSEQSNLKITHLGQSDQCGAILDDIEISRI